ncbi:unnamed protein product [Diadromus pulchellus idnoreovirus 1]|uniref:Uncharacterized protein S10 n=1 Tax=Diadromus pulchellus idnoreovirus 1 TaxID=37368 RepID=S10_DPIRV|nr:unnamed protein product [Diadromus pulchellus idnoreovirus 1]Q86282.1 RecName: Full=Uncharacterized protein S10 [Diadromus pulchellus idnoreovirus 1]CAA57561.1 unnamed protein product [Diadromus pulchellus idnoreovirus 1]
MTSNEITTTSTFSDAIIQQADNPTDINDARIYIQQGNKAKPITFQELLSLYTLNNIDIIFSRNFNLEGILSLITPRGLPKSTAIFARSSRTVVLNTVFRRLTLGTPGWNIEADEFLKAYNGYKQGTYLNINGALVRNSTDGSKPSLQTEYIDDFAALVTTIMQYEFDFDTFEAIQLWLTSKCKDVTLSSGSLVLKSTSERIVTRYTVKTNLNTINLYELGNNKSSEYEPMLKVLAMHMLHSIGRSIGQDTIVSRVPNINMAESVASGESFLSPDSCFRSLILIALLLNDKYVSL